jgi:hypothetical protein
MKVFVCRIYNSKIYGIPFNAAFTRVLKLFLNIALPTGKRPIGRPRQRWEDNITMDL